MNSLAALRTLGLACEVGGEMEIGVERGVLNAFPDKLAPHLPEVASPQYAY
jgi:hypothetical protein